MIIQSKLFQRIILSVFVLISGCSPKIETIEPTIIMTSTPTVAVSPTVTATVLPLALTVNGEGILLSEYESDLSRLRKENEGVSQLLPDDELENRVLDELIGQTMMAQTAYQNGFNLTEEELGSYLNGIIQSAGGEEVYQNWMRENGYQDESIKLTLKRQLAANWQRDQLIDQFPDTAPQVHAKQILLYDLETAQDVYTRLQAGTDFNELAKLYDPLTGGELGWFPKGYMTQPVVEQAAFELSQGQYSEIIESGIGFHIIQIMEKQDDRPLSGDARRILLQSYIDSWITEQREEAEIVITLP